VTVVNLSKRSDPRHDADDPVKFLAVMKILACIADGTGLDLNQNSTSPDRIAKKYAKCAVRLAQSSGCPNRFAPKRFRHQ
jgi:hypothetical protein